MGDFALGVYVTLCIMLLVAMLGFGPRLLEWIEGIPRDSGVRPPPPRREPASWREPASLRTVRRA